MATRRLVLAGGAAATAAALAVVALWAMLGKPAQPAPQALSLAAPRAGAATALQQAYVGAIAAVGPSVVQVETTAGLGSGVVLDREGDIVTNNHVVGTFRRFTVTDASGKRRAATLVGTYPQLDLAVIHASGAASLRPAVLADSSGLRVGDLVLAVGNPLGLQSSVTNGIVSALGRRVSERPGVVLLGLIQTSAAINPGNSGGALVDLDGRVVGIPTLGAIDPENMQQANGIGFAIPSDTVRQIAIRLVSDAPGGPG